MTPFLPSRAYISHITCCSSQVQTPRLTNCPCMVLCIKTCFLDHTDTYICSPGVADDSEGGWAGGDHAAICVSVFHRDPNNPSSFNLAPSPSSASDKQAYLALWCCTGPHRGILVGVSLLGLADWIYSSLRSHGRWGCVLFRCACSEPDTFFSGRWGGRMDRAADEREVEEAEDGRITVVPVPLC